MKIPGIAIFLIGIAILFMAVRQPVAPVSSLIFGGIICVIGIIFIVGGSLQETLRISNKSKQ